MKQRANKFKWLYVTFVFFKSFNRITKSNGNFILE